MDLAVEFPGWLDPLKGLSSPADKGLSLNSLKTIWLMIIENSNDGEPNWPEWLPDRLCKFWGEEEDKTPAPAADFNPSDWDEEF